MQGRLRMALVLSAGALVLVIAATLAAFVPWPALAETAGAAAGEGGGAAAPDPSVVRFGLIGAAIATGLSTVGAGYAVAAVGSAGIGALAEKPELMGRVLVLVGLAEGIAIYGLIVSILILNRVAA
jgi:V/A-type H+-transporting ATPase subunit K